MILLHAILVLLSALSFATGSSEETEKNEFEIGKPMQKFRVQLEKTESIRYNLEHQSKCSELNKVKAIKASQVIWLRHVFRYNDENPAKKITFLTPEGKKRKRGIPRARSMHKVEKWLKGLGAN
ncbi:hypothetical protein TNCV_4288481 [Trichonephila clavipes]|nr:hypothetical protein TNCV_4288481 [Trichonephila clavipes]